jgi:hypothetical protein
VESGEWRVESADNLKSTAANSNPQFPIPSPLFTIKTPTATVTDLGTEFGVEVLRSGATSTHVFRGVVEVRPTERDGNRAASVRLTENDSVLIENAAAGENPRVRHGLVDSATFVRVGQLPKMAEDRRLASLRRWQAYSRRLCKDPALIAYYTFEKHAGGTQVLPNISAAGHVLDGIIEGAEWVDGRLPGKLALCFRGPGSGNSVELPEPKRFDFAGPFSAAVWFKTERFTTIHQALITKGNTAWRVQRFFDKNFLTFDTTHAGGIDNTVGRTNAADGRWHLAVAVCSSTGNGMLKRFYMDGRLESEMQAKSPLARNSLPVCLGSNNRGCEFEGLIDEAAMFSRALSAAEVTAMFEAGNPDQDRK